MRAEAPGPQPPVPGHDAFVVAAARTLHPDGSLAPGWLTISGGRIAGFSGQPARRRADVVLRDGLLAPGFVDLQFNGALGVDLAAADAAGWERLRRAVPGSGVTGIVATFVSAPIPALVAALRRARSMDHGRPAGAARLLGVHLEGPFLAPAWRGAHDESCLLEPAPEHVRALRSAGGDLLRIVTLAPELPGAGECIATLTAAGIVVSVGHTGASAEQTARAVDQGARMVTHLYNAQTGLHHRRPGVVGHALTDPALTACVLADLVHVAPAALRLAFASKPGQVALVTDSVAAAGLSPGRYQMPDGEVVVRAAGPPERPDGTLAGSALRMDQAVRNAVAAGIPLATALRAASRVPADLLGRPDLGRIEAGARADLVWLSDDLYPRAVWIGGSPADLTPPSPGYPRTTKGAPLHDVTHA
jgi:N-acetylglucosamine-6-phosphate deacetylase